jgi:hypothetical protein
MYFKSKKIALLILGIASLLCSRILFLFFNDPEGPNLLVVVGMAVILYAPSSAVYLLNSRAAAQKRLLLATLTQLLIAAGFYFWLN